MQGLFSDVWMDQDVVSVDHCADITIPVMLASLSCYNPLFHFLLAALQMALFVIGVAGMRIYSLIYFFRSP